MFKFREKGNGLLPKVKERRRELKESKTKSETKSFSNAEKGKAEKKQVEKTSRKDGEKKTKETKKPKEKSNKDESKKNGDKKSSKEKKSATALAADDSDFDDDAETKDVYKGSTGLAVMNLSSRVLITVLIAIPFALREAGFGLGIILIIVIGFMSDYTLGLLIEAADRTGETTYIGIVRKLFGKFGVSGVVFKQFFYPFLLLVASNVLITDVLVKIIILISDADEVTDLDDNFYGRREFIISAATIVITLPLSLYKNIGQLSKYAACSLLLLITLTVFVIIRLVTLDMPDTPGAYRFAAIDVGRSIGILIAAFMVQHSSFMIFESMLLNDDEHELEVAHISISLSALFAMLFGVLGYATFTQNTQGNLLNNYCTDDTLINVGRVLFVLSVILAFPAEVIVARTVIELTLFKNRQPAPLWRHFLLTFLIVAGSVASSFLTDCLSIILELNGVTNAAPLAFVIPPMLILKLDKDTGFTCRKIPLYFVLITGLGVTFFGIILSIKSIVEGVECSHGREPAFCTAAMASDDLLENTTSIENVTFFDEVTILVPIGTTV